MDLDKLIEIDQKHIWHPYSSMTQPIPVYAVERAKGVEIYLKDGRVLIAHTEIDENKITNAVNQLRQKYDYILLEGAGGLAVPYTETKTTLDYLKTQQYPLILVSLGKLGSINHTLLSLMACRQYQIPLEALVYNRYLDQDSLISQNTEAYLLNYLQQYFPKAKFIPLDKIVF